MLLIVEPWAVEHWIEPGMSVVVIGQGGLTEGYFEIEHFNQGMIIYGWEGSIVSILQNGVVPD